jgi:ribosome biogenesis protein SSF1/2
LINHKKVPNLAKFNDIADFIMHSRKHRDGSMTSDSEAEDLPESKIVLPDDFQDKKKDSTVSIRLHELGPRMKLRLVKIQEGLCKGNVVINKFISKTPAQIKKQLDGLKNKRDLKEKRKQLQQDNVTRKQQRKQELEKLEQQQKALKQQKLDALREQQDQPVLKVRKSGKRDDAASRLAADVDEGKDARGQQRVGKKRFNRAVAAEREEMQKAK